MNKLLLILLSIAATGLCALCYQQWLREADLRKIQANLTRELNLETAARIEAEDRATAYETEIARISQLRADTEAKLIEVTATLQLTEADQQGRGYSIATLAGELQKSRQVVATVQAQLAAHQEAIAERNGEVTDQNSVVTEANTRLKALTAERDKAIRQLNQRTAEFNALVEKYNKLVN
ncbi:MAG: hypothetical protein KDK97_23315 [Verrucomicrobiales bacterium]|nr:hypothetical protein [Verrucomicrobiales bacterium]MCP5560286.1 hypothetical protein [Verrucomicrobiaceae bacterium]